MSNLTQTLKAFGLTKFYFSLSVTDKGDLDKYSKHMICRLPKSPNHSAQYTDCFQVSNGAQFLWVTAANAIPHKKLDFAEHLLNHALTLAVDVDDIAWIHANLAQVYYEKHKTDPAAGRKSIMHCRELIKLGFMKSWAENMMQELSVFQV